MKIRDIIATYYPQYVWYGTYPIEQCAAFNRAGEEWGILGNFGRAHVTVNGVEFYNTEQLFHMMKFRNPEALLDIYSVHSMAIKRKAKKWEKTCLREDWPNMLVDAMKFCLVLKYEQSEEFRNELNRSKGLYIVEDESSRRSTSYGMQIKGNVFEGSNLMGRLLMELRDNGKLEYNLPEDALEFIDILKNRE